MPDQSVAGWPAPRRVLGGWPLDAAALAGLAAVTLLLAARTWALDVDVAVAGWCDAHRPEAVAIGVDALNRFGQGGPLSLVALGLAAWRARASHSIRPFAVVAATYALIGFFILPMKLVGDRLAPHQTESPHPERLFEAATGTSYPSGHVANSIVWYVAMMIVLGGLLSRPLRLVMMIMPVVVITATTTYLGYHWLSDDVAGALVGVVAARLLLRVPWDTVPLGGFAARRKVDGPAGLGVPPDPDGASPGPDGASPDPHRAAPDPDGARSARDPRGSSGAATVQLREG